MSGKTHRPVPLSVKRLLGLVVGIGLVTLVFHLADFSWQDTISHILQARLYILFSVLFCTAMIYYVATLRWKYIVKDLTVGTSNVPIGYLYHYIAMGSMSGLVLPLVLGDVSIRSLFLKLANGVPLSRAAYSIILDQVITVMTNSIFLLPALAFLLNKITMQEALPLALVMMVLFIVITWRFNQPIFSTVARFYSWIIYLVTRIPFLRSGRADFQPTASDFSVSSNTILKVLVCGQIKYILIILRLYIVAISLSLDISFWTFFLGCSLVLTLSLISFIPANLGLSELGWYGVLRLAGVPDQNIVTFIICERISFSLSIIFVGGITWLVYQIFHSGR